MSDSVDWKKAENITALIEKAISPDAHVQTNVRLPVIGTKRTRQCDVVIHFGKPPRSALAIVEVQKRNRKPHITTFHGWVRKMQEVGAQQLFCVSALGYPKSIIEDVSTRIGPTVKLLTLEDLTSTAKVSPFMLAPFITDPCLKYQITDFGTPKLLKKGQMSFNLDTAERFISIGANQETHSLNELISSALNNVPGLSKIAPHEIENWTKLVKLPLESLFESIWLNIDDQRIQVQEWIIGLKLYTEPKYTPIPAIHLEYKQEFLDDKIAWVAHSQFNYNGQDLELNIVVMPDEQGYLRNVRVWCTQT